MPPGEYARIAAENEAIAAIDSPLDCMPGQSLE
jgi:hypothetical protein